MTNMEVQRILAPLLRIWTEKGVSVGLEPDKAKQLLLWTLPLAPLEWVFWPDMRVPGDARFR